MSYWIDDTDIAKSKITLLEQDLRFYRTEHRTMALKNQELEKEVNRLKGALHYLIERCAKSDDCQYGTLSTAFVREIAEDALLEV